MRTKALLLTLAISLLVAAPAEAAPVLDQEQALIDTSSFFVNASAAAGDLDPTFDGDGKVLTDFSGDSADFGYDVAAQSDGKVSTDFTPDSNELAYAMAIQPDGKILAAGEVSSDASNRNFALVRYNGDGSLDTSFDGDGKVATDITGIEKADAIALQPDA
jgi:uncharacterized delta-60 repeat protein